MQEHLAKSVDPERIVAAVTGGGDPSSVLEFGVATVRNQQPSENTFRDILFSRLALPPRSCRRLTVRAGRAVKEGREDAGMCL
jgi:hypothetical protein